MDSRVKHGNDTFFSGLDSFAACFDYFHRCFLWSDHSGVDGKKDKLNAISQAV